MIHPEGSKDATLSIPVPVGFDGIARFHAVRATAGDAVQRLSLDCVSSAGESTTTSVDLRSDETFVARPENLAQAPGLDRPALQGDPASWSQADLLRLGYGMRPDPAASATAYARWLASATKPARRLQSATATATAQDTRTLKPETTSVGTAPNWTGALLTGAPTYVKSQATFVVPTPIPGGDGTGNTQVSVWTGLGGFGTAGGLIQGGVWLNTTPSTLSLFSFTEYCCGDNPANGRYQSFNPNPGDTIFVQEWYCDPNGALNADVNNNGGYGCSIVHDETSGAIMSCTSSTDPICTSVPPLYQSNWVIGNSAEFILELTPFPSYTDFAGTLAMSGEAETSTGAWNTLTTDPKVTKLEDFTPTTNVDHVAVSFSSTDTVDWVVTPGGPDLLWQNTTTGDLSAWLTNGTTVTGQEELSWKCGPSNGCVSQWNVIDGQANSLLWDNPSTGAIQAWRFDSLGNVTADPALSWTCTAASGCASTWHAIGRVTEGGNAGLLWYDATSGALSIWNLTGSTVTGSQTVNWTCGAGCAGVWQPLLTADMNGDGNTDVVWYDAATGAVSSWLLNGATVTGQQQLSWTCNASNGCSSTWKVIGAADVNRDGHTDLTWYDGASGQVSTWLLNGAGTVTGKQTLTTTCSAASGCASTWRPLGYVEFP